MARPAKGRSSGSFGPLPSKADDELGWPAAEVAQDGVGELAFHLDVFFARNGIARAAVCRAGVAEQLAEEVRQEVGQDFLFLELVRLAAGEQLGPFLELRPQAQHRIRQGKGGDVGANHVGAEQGFCFDGHSGLPFSSRRVGGNGGGSEQGGTVRGVGSFRRANVEDSQSYPPQARSHMSPIANGLKLFVVGESTGNPTDWDWVCHRAIVAARSAEEAVRLVPACGPRVSEIRLSEPMVLCYEEDDGSRE